MAVEFRGDVGRFVLRGVGYFGLNSAVLSFVLLGNRWLHFFLVSLVLVTPLIGLRYLITAARRPSGRGRPKRLRWWLLATPVLIFASGELYFARLAQKFPGVRAPCAFVDWKMASAGYRSERIASFVYALPDGFARRTGEHGHHGLIFRSGEDLLFYTYSLPDWGFMSVPAVAHATELFLFYGFGIRNKADRVRFVACATRSVVPLAVRSRLLGASGARRLEFDGGVAIVWETERHPWRAELYPDWLAEVYFDAEDRSDLYIGIGSTERIDNQLLKEIVSRVEYRPEND
jgi:hypothetical protein